MNNKKLIWIGISLIFLIGIGVVISALNQNNNDYINNELNKVSFTETNNPEQYSFSFPIGNKIYGVNVDNSSDLWYKDDNGNIIGLNAYGLQWTIAYGSLIQNKNLTEENTLLKARVSQLEINVNLLCSASILC